MAAKLKVLFGAIIAVTGLVAVPVSAYDWGQHVKKVEKSTLSAANPQCLIKDSNVYCYGIRGKPVPFKEIMSHYRDWA